jgi:hypothetical protein
VEQAAEGGTGRWSVSEFCATRPNRLGPAQDHRYEEIPRILRTGTDVGWILRVVEMSELRKLKRLAACDTGTQRRADEYLHVGSLVDLCGRETIARYELVVLRQERLGARCGQAEARSNDGCHGNHRQNRSNSAR